MKILAISVTERGRELAGRLPFESVHGNLARTVRERWETTDCFVLLIAVGAAVRIVAPLIASSEQPAAGKQRSSSPGVVCVDDAGRFAIAVLGGHLHASSAGTKGSDLSGANDVARKVAALLDATPVVTTATDVLEVCPLDTLKGLVASGDIAGVSRAMIDGARPVLENRLGWPLPGALVDLCDAQTSRPGQLAAPDTGRTQDEDGSGISEDQLRRPLIIVTDADEPEEPGVVLLHPPSIVAGVGTSTGATLAELQQLLSSSLEAAGVSSSSLAEIATAVRRADDPAIAGLQKSIRSFTTNDLAGVKAPTPSSVVNRAVGTPSVAEAAALLAAGPGGRLVLEKRKSQHATVALARRGLPPGSVSIVGIGPGASRHRTPAAEIAIRDATVIIGYAPYLDACSDLIGPHHEVERYAIGEELIRARRALEAAAGGHRVALVCSGDPGVYGMASLLVEASENAARHSADGGSRAGAVNIHVVPGVTASLASAATLGAPLANDYLVISLSDHLTPWELIKSRILAAATADLAIAIYNPRSGVRKWQLGAAQELLLLHRSPETPVGIVTDVSRPGEQARLTTLASLDTSEVGMTSCVIVGSSRTRVVRGLMVTPRGYLPPPAPASQP